MARDPVQAPPDHERLALLLAALAYPLRLEILQILHFPKVLGEIRVSPMRVEPGENEDRPASKPTVLAHLEKLVEAGLVRAEPFEQRGKIVRSYAVNPQRLYAIVEDLRRLSASHAGYGVGEDVTGTMAEAPSLEEPQGARLVLVHGLHDGRQYPLRDTSATDGRWTIGRAETACAPLDYDPFVSMENAHITRKDGRYVLQDHAESKNGTSVNWRALPRGGSRALRTGDVIGVGRSLLVFIES